MKIRIQWRLYVFSLKSHFHRLWFGKKILWWVLWGWYRFNVCVGFFDSRTQDNPNPMKWIPRRKKVVCNIRKNLHFWCNNKRHKENTFSAHYLSQCYRINVLWIGSHFQKKWRKCINEYLHYRWMMELGHTTQSCSIYFASFLQCMCTNRQFFFPALD